MSYETIQQLIRTAKNAYHYLDKFQWAKQQTWDWLLPSSDDDPNKTFSTHTPVEDNENARDICTTGYGANLALMLGLSAFYPGSFVAALGIFGTIGVTGILLNQISTFQRNAVLEKQGEETEKAVAELLVPLSRRYGGTLYSKLDDCRLRIAGMGDLDILLNFPGESFAISVKSKKLEKKDKLKVFWDRDRQKIRYSKNGSKSDFETNIIQDLNKRVDWLSAHRGNLISPQPHRIVVWKSYPLDAPSICVSVFPDSPKEVLGGSEFLTHQGVYVTEAENLVSLIQSLRRKMNTAQNG
ncbi:MAG: hypothetical protein F6K28_36615 [Microcoleus sp. SIO2G3]|nr:hypothetical protein [Microcoleus sp. SIO2G3]